MAAPTIVLKYNTGTEGSPSWTEIASGEKIWFTGSGSSAGTLKPIPRPTGANKVTVAHECWIDKASDDQVDLYDGGGGSVGDYVTDIFPTDPTNTNPFAIQADTNPESQAGVLEAWDDVGYDSIDIEILAGTTNLGTHSQLRAAETASNVLPSAGAGTIPAGYKTQTAQTVTYQLQGSTRCLTFTSALSAGNQNRFVFHNFVVDDSAPGSLEVELTYHYFYT